MKYNKSVLRFLAGTALFAGFMIVLNVAPYFPAMINLTTPLLCRGTAEVELHNYADYGYPLEVYCRSGDGSRKEITIRVIGLTGVAASLFIFVILFAWLRLRKSDWLRENEESVELTRQSEFYKLNKEFDRGLDGPDETGTRQTMGFQEPGAARAMGRRPEMMSPCPHCGATKFGIIEKASVEIWCAAKRGSGNVLNPTFTICVCTGCGATTFFNASDENNLLGTCIHETVDMSQQHAMAPQYKHS